MRIVTAESCTGGLIAGLLTEIPGSSDVVERGFVTYSNKAKEELLGVPSDLICAAWRGVGRGGARHGGRRAETFPAQNCGGGDRHRRTRRRHGGKAGRAGVYRRGARGDHVIAQECRFGDIGRGEVRLKSVATALEMLAALL